MELPAHPPAYDLARGEMAQKVTRDTILRPQLCHWGGPMISVPQVLDSIRFANYNLDSFSVYIVFHTDGESCALSSLPAPLPLYLAWGELAPTSD